MLFLLPSTTSLANSIPSSLSKVLEQSCSVLGGLPDPRGESKWGTRPPLRGADIRGIFMAILYYSLHCRMKSPEDGIWSFSEIRLAWCACQKMSASQVLQVVYSKPTLIWCICLACWINERNDLWTLYTWYKKRQIHKWWQKLGANFPYRVTHRVSILLILLSTCKDSCWKCDILLSLFCWLHMNSIWKVYQDCILHNMAIFLEVCFGKKC